MLDEKIDLNVKGAAWLVVFPEPNRTVQLRMVQGQPDQPSASEARELSADEASVDYDLLVKAIDTGFRVASNAQPERFVLSVQLARLIASANPGLGFDHQVRLDQPTVLKGVNKNEPYSILFIDTMEHLPTRDSRLLEREVMRECETSNSARLDAYLEAYCSV